jgi:hypothetical protein
MKRFIPTILALAIASPALADGDAELQNVGSCLAFAVVRADLDGKADIPADMLPGLNALKDEFMFRATAAKLQEEEAQKIIVKALVDQNSYKAEHGLAALEGAYGTLCKNIAATLMVKPQQP